MTKNAGFCNEKYLQSINGLPTLAAPLNPSCRAVSGQIPLVITTQGPFSANPAK
jgi:hypothetical protein